MGVVHKLKQEVIDYIFIQKQENPSISCRELSKNVSEKFQIAISKSSINTILKNAQLSNPVGRRVLSEPSPRKYKIPAEKKIEFFSHPSVLPEVKPVMPKVDDKTELKMELERLLDEKKSETAPQYEINPTVSKESYEENTAQEEALPLIPDSTKSEGFLEKIPIDNTLSELIDSQEQSVILNKVDKNFIEEEFHDYVRQIRAQKKINMSQRLDGMGLVFLKAAEWEFSRSSLLSGILSRYISGIFPLQKESACEVLLYLELLKIRSVQDLDKLSNHAIWVLNGFKEQKGLELLLGWVKVVLEERSLALELHQEQMQASERVDHFRVYLENGNMFYLDPMMAKYYYSEPAVTSSSPPVYKALYMLSKYFIGNITEAPFYPLTGSLKDLDGLCDIFENFNKSKIVKVGVCNALKEEVASFSVVPHKKRNFSTVVMPGFELWEEVIAKHSQGGVRPFYNLWLDKVLYYSESTFNPKASGVSLRSIFLKKEVNADPCMVLLTNNQNARVEDIITQYFLRWPSLTKFFSGTGQLELSQEGGHDLDTKKETINSNIELPGSFLNTLPEAMYSFLDLLNQHCLDSSFNMSGMGTDLASMKARYYDVQGKFIRSETMLNIHLCPPKNYQNIEILKKAVDCLNNRDIHDPYGRKLYVELT